MSERGIIEAKLREVARAAEAVAECALEETLAPGDRADVILAALKESRKADIDAIPSPRSGPKGTTMRNDEEAVRMVADELRARHVVDRVESHVVVRVAEAIVSKLSRLEQSRVERAVELARRAAWRYYPNSVEAELFGKIVAILTAQDSSAGSPVPVTGSGSAVPPEAQAGAQTVVKDPSSAGEPGGRSSPPPAEVKPSERIQKAASHLEQADDLRFEGSGLEHLLYAVRELHAYLDEQHARGRK